MKIKKKISPAAGALWGLCIAAAVTLFRYRSAQSPPAPPAANGAAQGGLMAEPGAVAAPPQEVNVAAAKAQLNERTRLVDVVKSSPVQPTSLGPTLKVRMGAVVDARDVLWCLAQALRRYDRGQVDNFVLRFNKGEVSYRRSSGSFSSTRQSRAEAKCSSLTEDVVKAAAAANITIKQLVANPPAGSGCGN